MTCIGHQCLVKPYFPAAAQYRILMLQLVQPGNRKLAALKGRWENGAEYITLILTSSSGCCQVSGRSLSRPEGKAGTMECCLGATLTDMAASGTRLKGHVRLRHCRSTGGYPNDNPEMKCCSGSVSPCLCMWNDAKLQRTADLVPSSLLDQEMEGGGGERKVDASIPYTSMPAFVSIANMFILDYSSSYSPMKNQTSPNLVVLKKQTQKRHY